MTVCVCVLDMESGLLLYSNDAEEKSEKTKNKRLKDSKMRNNDLRIFLIYIQSIDEVDDIHLCHFFFSSCHGPGCA